MPIIYNITSCVAHGYNTSPCWINYTIQTATNSSVNTAIPNPLSIVTLNLPWVGMAIWVITYLALFILFSKSGGREKFMGIAFGGFIASIVYAQAGLLGSGTPEASLFAFSFFIVIISIIAYALVKDSGE